jgi:hypothetical protein
MTEPTNATRAELGRIAIETNPETERTSCVCDVLANIMHYCDREGIDFYAALHSAERHYDAEKNEEGA